MNTQDQTIELKAFTVAGVKYRPGDIIDVLETGDTIRLLAEPENQFDTFAIRVEGYFPHQDEMSDEGVIKEHWELIGYVPKKETWIYHILRKAGVKLFLKLFVNQDAPDDEKLHVKVSYQGNEENAF